MALADLVDIRVEFGLGAAGDTGSLWDTALWDEGTWSSNEISWSDMTSLVQSFTTRTGKRANVGAALKQSRTGTAVFVMDNTKGVFIPGSSGIPPGFLELRPGRYVRIMARSKRGAIPPSSTPIPDGYTWTDSTGRVWTAHGTGLTLYDPGFPSAEYVPIWFGRIDTIDDKSIRGDETAKVSCTDAFAELAVNTQPAVPEVGSGDTASQRITRILDNAGWPEDRRDIASGGYQMQATTMAQNALQLCQTVTDSTGGDFWQGPDGDLVWRDIGWRSDTPDWYFGGLTGLPVRSATPEWSLFRVVNETHLARRNGNEQVASDAGSISKYGRRTHTRLDFENLNDADVATLGVGIVTALRNDRMVLTDISVLVQDFDTVDFVTNIELGQMLQVTIQGMPQHGVSNTYRCHVISIADETSAEGWVMTLGLDSADIANVDGPYSVDEYSDAYHLGGH